VLACGDAAVDAASRQAATVQAAGDDIVLFLGADGQPAALKDR
jgi:ABC-type sugar transport system substrate-binding protein